MVTGFVIVGRSEVRAIVWTPPAAMLKSIVSPPAPAFTLLIAPRREQSFAAAAQVVRFASEVVSTVKMLAADAGAAASASAARVAPNPIRIARPARLAPIDKDPLRCPSGGQGGPRAWRD